jgi:CheY-like chemotaxis protein
VGIGGTITISTVNRYIDQPFLSYDDFNEGEYVILSVADNGPGISKEDLESIFEPFYTKKIMGRSGTGLGLAVVWNIVQDHKGYIDLISEKNQTSFNLYFPVTRQTVSDEKPYKPIEDYRGNGEKILIVDDIDSQREIVSEMLKNLGYSPASASSGEEAVEYLKRHDVHLIILDMIMDPGINGRETYERILAMKPGQKAIITSGFAETDEVKKAQDLGAGRFIRKPFTLENLGMAVKEGLEKK